jgi:RHS repeat-associated protein
MTNPDGSIYQKTRYMPYGGKRDEGPGITATSYLFTDQELDAESGLYNYDARLYDPVVGRFVSADTVIPKIYSSQAVDRFAYTLNNPIKYTDPSGHFVACATAIGYGLVEAAVSLGALTAAAVIGDWLGDLVNEARSKAEPKDEPNVPANASNKTKSKDKRAADKERTDKQKSDNKHKGDSEEAHNDQKNAGSLELSDKEQGIKSGYPEQSAHKTKTNLKEKMKKEAQEELDKMKNEQNANQNTNNSEPGGEGGNTNNQGETTNEPI